MVTSILRKKKRFFYFFIFSFFSFFRFFHFLGVFFDFSCAFYFFSNIFSFRFLAFYSVVSIVSTVFSTHVPYFATVAVFFPTHAAPKSDPPTHFLKIISQISLINDKRLHLSSCSTELRRYRTKLLDSKFSAVDVSNCTSQASMQHTVNTPEGILTAHRALSVMSLVVYYILYRNGP